MFKSRCYENNLLTQSDLSGGFPEFGKLPCQTFFKGICVVLFCAYPYSLICLFVPNFHGLCLCLKLYRNESIPGVFAMGDEVMGEYLVAGLETPLFIPDPSRI